MILKYKEELILQKQKNALLAETVEKDKELDIDVDTYSMAFKALHYKSMQQQELNPEDVHDAFENALFVFFI